MTQGSATISTHVLDAVLGKPAAGLEVRLDSAPPIATDDDGRIRFETAISLGAHQLVFATGPWFSSQGRETFYPRITIDFEVSGAQPHYHVAVLLSPFAYTSYRGS